jgi:2-dehydro-3-deoxygluconokinase
VIRTVCIGEAMVELRPIGPGTLARAVAGDAYNTAVYLRRSLGPAGETAFLTVVGDDPVSADLLADFRRQGVDDRLVFRAPGRLPGLYLIELDARGERSFHYWRGESAARDWMAALKAAGGAAALAGVDLVFLSGISLAILPPADRLDALALLAELPGRSVRIAFDPNVRPRLWRDPAEARETLEPAMGLADILLASQDDGAWLWNESDPGAQMKTYRALGGGEIAITLGADGALVFANGAQTGLPGPVVRVADTSGAGDSFNGAYIAARLAGAAPQAAALAGQALAARVVSHPGALIAVDLSHPPEVPTLPDPP